MTDQPEPRVVVVGPDGALHEAVPSAAGHRGEPATTAQELAEAGAAADTNVASELVSQPDKVMRIGTMIKQLLEEVRVAPLDDASRVRLREIHRSSIRELSEALAPAPRAELERLLSPFEDDVVPSDAELRIAQAQLVGWLEGLFHGMLVVQQVADRAQLAELRRRALPSGAGLPDGAQPQQEQGGGESFGRGAYL
ncbi:bacterial proteasome activator family protein [Frankia sp. AgPm24]|uniref:bacterial proteasome activator family protein n=1 Tax=Frankia sp. AgPm24 TaxID=631128 RepID=UPI00200C05F9|nr:bacterial proteasome activator family protein [Frankia sp. AgPm24]MCK9920848.1 bacterial proteasome activator family protein [Frankia sp. AgPm24]